MSKTRKTRNRSALSVGATGLHLMLALLVIVGIAGATFLLKAVSNRASSRESVARRSGDSETSQVQLGPAPPRHPVFTYQLIKSRPHDPGAFTQGLVYHQGFLYESTGLLGQSSLRKVDLETGQVLAKVDVPSQYFAEGLAIHNDRAIQLTWQHQIGFVYQLANFQPLQNFAYTGEGWGLTHDSHLLILSDGTNKIRFLDPQTFQIRRSIEVFDGTLKVDRLNELEYIDGEIYANVWLTDRIVRISPDSGKVNSTIDLTGLLSAADRQNHVDVLNGIAFDAAQRRLFVTGKLWPKLFEIKLILKGRATRPRNP